ncbi:MAG: hypothetical protein JNJ43_10865 [Anaerolineales bacterium]|nr:hypothetical protein [Anaerolineales bacterium]
MNDKKIYNVFLFVFVGIGAVIGIVIYQYNSIIANSLLGISTIYILYFNDTSSVVRGTLEELIIRKDKIKVLFYASFRSFVLALSLNTIIKVLLVFL